MSFAVPKVAAEIGAVHLGSMERAKMLIDYAYLCNADFVKFQKRNPDESVPESMKSQPHPNKIFAYGDTYLAHRKALELTVEQHADLKKYCDKLGIRYACSVWDFTSAKEIIEIDPAYIKIPSACNNNQQLIKYVIDNFAGNVHISTGMTTREARFDLVKYLSHWPTRIVLYHCTSAYPCTFDKLHLLEIEEFCSLKPMGMRIGFSNHGYGIAADVAAYVLGAEYIERHFVDDRTLRHTDAAASLEPDGLRKLCRDLKNVYSALTYRDDQMHAEEYEQMKKLRINVNGQD